MPRDPIIASRQRVEAYEAQERSLKTEANRMIGGEIWRHMGEDSKNLSDEEIYGLRDGLVEDLRKQLKNPIPDPTRGPELRDLNPLNFPSRAADAVMASVEPSLRPTGFAEMTGTEAVNDILTGQTPEPESVGNLLEFGLTTTGAAAGPKIAAKLGRRAFPYAWKAGQSIIGGAAGAFVSGTQKAQFERAQEILEQANALRDRRATGEALLQAQEDVTATERVLRGASEALLETSISGGFAFGPGLAKVGFAKLAGLATHEANLLINRLERYGISPSVADVTPHYILQRGADILGKFPIAGPTVRRAARMRGQQVSDAVSSSVDSLAPIVTELTELSGDRLASRQLKANVDAFNRVEAYFTRFKEEANTLYRKFEEAAYRSGATVGPANSGLVATIERQKLRNLPKNVTLTGKLKEIDEKFTEIMSMPEDPTLQQFTNLGRQIESLIKDFPTGSPEARSLLRVKKAMEADIASNLNGDIELLRMRDAANEFYKEGMEILAGQAARRFRRVDRNFGKVATRELTDKEALEVGLSAGGARSPGTVIPTLLKNADDPAVIQNLYTLLTKGNRQEGKAYFREIVGVHLHQAMEGATSAVDGGTLRFTDVNKLKKQLGLDNMSSEKAKVTREMFKAAGVSVDEFNEVLDLASAYWDGKTPDISQFVARRAVMGGFGSLVRSFAPGVGKSQGGSAAVEAVKSIASTAAAMVLLRGATKQLVDPNVLRAYRDLLDPKLSMRAHQNAIARLIAMDATFLALDEAGINQSDQVQAGVTAGLADMINQYRSDTRLDSLGGRLRVNQPLPEEKR